MYGLRRIDAEEADTGFLPVNHHVECIAIDDFRNLSLFRSFLQYFATQDIARWNREIPRERIDDFLVAGERQCFFRIPQAQVGENLSEPKRLASQYLLGKLVTPSIIRQFAAGKGKCLIRQVLYLNPLNGIGMRRIWESG